VQWVVKRAEIELSGPEIGRPEGEMIILTELMATSLRKELECEYMHHLHWLRPCLHCSVLWHKK